MSLPSHDGGLLDLDQIDRRAGIALLAHEVVESEDEPNRVSILDFPARQLGTRVAL
jgi:hypothetical protein